MIALDSLSTGTPGSHWKHRSNHLIRQFTRRTLDRLPGAFRLGVDLCLRLTHLGSCCLSRGIQRTFRSRHSLLGPLLSHFENFGPRLAQLIGILRRLGFRLRDCLMSVFDGAFGPGTALGKCPSQRTLHQQLVGRDQHHKEQNGRDGAEQKRTDLLKNFIPCLYSVNSGRRVIFNARGTPFCIRGKPLRSTPLGAM